MTTLVPKIEAVSDTNEQSKVIPEGVDLICDQKGPSTEGSKACSLCRIMFHTVEDQRGHIRSDLHGYNLKQKLRGLPAVSEEEFERLVEGKKLIQSSQGAV